jgi:ribose/xylose/arabinose/galactoside ABC-type transport system permease subunit
MTLVIVIRHIDLSVGFLSGSWERSLPSRLRSGTGRSGSAFCSCWDSGSVRAF